MLKDFILRLAAAALIFALLEALIPEELPASSDMTAAAVRVIRLALLAAAFGVELVL